MANSTGHSSQFGSLLRAHRIARKLRQQDLAELLHYDQSLLSKIERGERRPTAAFVHSLCSALDLDRSQERELNVAAEILPPVEAPAAWPLGVRPILRRTLYWFTAGMLFALAFFTFVAIRFFFVQRHHVTLHDLLASGNLASSAVVLTQVAILLVVTAIPLGFVIHQVYFALYWQIGIRLRSEGGDPSFELLKTLQERYEFSYPRAFGTDLQASAGVRQAGFSGFGDGSRTWRMRSNWRLLRSVWLDAISRGKIEYTDALIGLKDDTFSLQGACLVAIAAAFALYLLYDLSAHWASIVQGDFVYLLATIPNAFVASIGIAVFRAVRLQTGVDAIETRRMFLYFAYERAGPPNVSIAAKRRRWMHEPAVRATHE